MKNAEPVFQKIHTPFIRLGDLLKLCGAAMTGGDLTHDGDSVFASHIGHARRRKAVGAYDEDRRPMWTVSKASPGSPLKIDAAVAGCISWEARGDAIAAGAVKRTRRRPAVFI